MKTWDKTKSPISLEEEIKKQSENIFNDFEDFSDGYRVLFLLQRNKEGGEVNNTKIQKVITRNKKEYLEGIKKLLKLQYESEATLRIYACVNERDFDKAIRQFKYEQLEADYYDKIQKENFYIDIRNRFIGCLMQPPQRKTSYFLYDVDNEEGRDVCGETLTALGDEVEIIKMYPSKNGWHIITKPFNHTTIELPEGVEMKKDALLLLSF